MSSFNSFLGQPEVSIFTESNHVVSREHYSEDEALKIYQDLDPNTERKDLEAKWVQYCIGEDDDDFDGGKAWWIKDSPGRNRKKVWVVG